MTARRRTASAYGLLDEGSRYASLHRMTTDKGYLYVTVAGHPVADSRGRVRLHRAVLYDAIGPGSHRCRWCQWDGLRWDIDDSNDPDYLTVDHLNSDKTDNRLGNLCASHGYCNSYRSTIKQLHIPWSVFEQMPPAGRPSLRNTQTGLPTQAAHDLAKLAAPVRGQRQLAGNYSAGNDPEGVRKSSSLPLAERQPIRKGFVRWEDLLR